jgi:hypothetical protein
MSDAPHLHVSHHAINRYSERILMGPASINDRATLFALEAEIFCLLARCNLPQFPRYVATVGRARFVIIGGVVVTTLAPGGVAWVGRHAPNHQTEVEIHDR